PTVALRVALACTFCHEKLRREEAAFCAACLAPHHSDCFETHGRCSAHGCGETRTVGTSPRRWRRTPVFALVASFGVAMGVAFAVSVGPRSAERDESSKMLKESGHLAVDPTPVSSASIADPAPVAAAAPVTTSQQEAPLPSLEEALAELGEPDEAPPPYPWPELEGWRDDSKLDGATNVDLHGTLGDVARFLEA